MYEDVFLVVVFYRQLSYFPFFPLLFGLKDFALELLAGEDFPLALELLSLLGLSVPFFPLATVFSFFSALALGDFAGFCFLSSFFSSFFFPPPNNFPMPPLFPFLSLSSLFFGEDLPLSPLLISFSFFAAAFSCTLI